MTIDGIERLERRVTSTVSKILSGEGSRHQARILMKKSDTHQNHLRSCGEGYGISMKLLFLGLYVCPVQATETKYEVLSPLASRKYLVTSPLSRAPQTSHM